MNYLITLSLLLLLTSCNYTVSMSHSEGKATDVIDNNSQADADISPELDLPGVL